MATGPNIGTLTWCNTNSDCSGGTTCVPGPTGGTTGPNGQTGYCMNVGCAAPSTLLRGPSGVGGPTNLTSSPCPTVPSSGVYPCATGPNAGSCGSTGSVLLTHPAVAQGNRQNVLLNGQAVRQRALNGWSGIHPVDTRPQISMWAAIGLTILVLAIIAVIVALAIYWGRGSSVPTDVSYVSAPGAAPVPITLNNAPDVAAGYASIRA